MTSSTKLWIVVKNLSNCLFLLAYENENTQQKKKLNQAKFSTMLVRKMCIHSSWVFWCCWWLKEATWNHRATAMPEDFLCRFTPADRKIDWREKFCVQAHRTIHAIAISFWNSFDVFCFMFCHFQVFLFSEKKKLYHDMSYAARFSSSTEIRSY